MLLFLWNPVPDLFTTFVLYWGDRLEIILFSPNYPPINRKVAISAKDLNELVLDFRFDLKNPTS